MITEDQLRQIVPRCEDLTKWIKPLNDTFRKFNIVKSHHLAGFLAQVAVESDNLNRVEENLRYTAARLVQVWPRRFKDATAAAPYAYNPQKLASFVYADRMGNGPERTGDGYRYRGRGLIQITGRGNYEVIGKTLELNLVEFPDALLEPKWAALSAGAFWHLRVRDQAADTPGIEDDTRIVNGGLHGIEYRKQVYARALGVFSVNDDLDLDKGRKAGASRQAGSQAVPAAASAWL